MDKVLIRMPQEFEYWLPAASVAQNYISQQYFQWHTKTKVEEPRFTIEVGDDSHLYLNSMFPHMEFAVREQELIDRGAYSCIIDFRDVKRVLNVATPTQKHLTEAWSAMFGASAPPLPVLGPIAVTCRNPKYHFLIDETLEFAEELKYDLTVKHIEWMVSARVSSFQGKRLCHQFEQLADCSVFVGWRSGASYLAAVMQKGCVEIWPRTIPFWFLSKPKHDGQRILIGDRPSKEIVFEQICSLLPSLIAKAA